MLLSRALVLILTLIYSSYPYSCVHDHVTQNMPNTKHFYNDINQYRLLQTPQNGRIRIFVDYSQVTIGGKTEIHTIRRAVNISASYYYNLLNVTRLTKLYFPNQTNTEIKCGKFKVPEKYLTEGTIGDIGVLCGNQNSPSQTYIAQSTSCAYLQSNKRPIWGMMAWNNPFLKYDQVGFQEIVSIGIHELTHILGFSAELYETYPLGNPLRYSQSNDQYYLWSQKIEREILNHYNCSIKDNAVIKGLALEDQDGTIIPSHWEKKIVGNEIMIAGNSKNMYQSIFTLALLEATGWYLHVNQQYAEPMIWGKNKGCKMMDIDLCNEGKQFCNTNEFQCDLDGTAIARCDTDLFTGGCKIPKHYTNTICIDQNYELKNLNSKLNALERGGSNSKCFRSDLRAEGLLPTALNFRCYVAFCSYSGRYLYILIGRQIRVCTKQGLVISAVTGMDGTLTCPESFENYCSTKKTCAYHCNKNGVCINGQCQCTGQKTLSQVCMDVSIFEAPIGETGGFLNSKKSKTTALNISNIPDESNSNQPERQRALLYDYSLNSKCIQGSTFDQIFGICLHCSSVFACEDCNQLGCISCDDGRKPINGRC